MKRHILAFALALLFLPHTVAVAQEDDRLKQLTPPGAVLPTGPTPDWAQYKNPFAGEQNDLANPHRTGEEITAWGSRAVADVLTFRPGDFKAQILSAQKYFVQEGWAGFAAYLKDSQLLDVAQKGTYAVSAVANKEPMITGSGLQNGAWHWRLSVPILISVSASDPQGVLQPVSSRRTVIALSLTRVAEGGDDGIAIDGWTAQDE